MRVKRLGERDRIETPHGAPLPERALEHDDFLLKALACAFRRRQALESGDYGSIADLARAEMTSRAYVAAAPGGPSSRRISSR